LKPNREERAETCSPVRPTRSVSRAARRFTEFGCEAKQAWGLGHHRGNHYYQAIATMARFADALATDLIRSKSSRKPKKKVPP